MVENDGVDTTENLLRVFTRLSQLERDVEDLGKMLDSLLEMQKN
jgi:uncharacterized protein YjiS (DUF1127 family)